MKAQGFLILIQYLTMEHDDWHSKDLHLRADLCTYLCTPAEFGVIMVQAKRPLSAATELPVWFE
jgi:hypothetical protein